MKPLFHVYAVIDMSQDPATLVAVLRSRNDARQFVQLQKDLGVDIRAWRVRRAKLVPFDN